MIGILIVQIFEILGVQREDNPVSRSGVNKMDQIISASKRRVNLGRNFYVMPGLAEQLPQTVRKGAIIQIQCQAQGLLLAKVDSASLLLPRSRQARDELHNKPALP